MERTPRHHMPEPVAKFCVTVMNQMAEAVAGAREGSPLDVAFKTLGPSFAAVASAAMRRHVELALTTNGPETLRLLRDGNVGVRTVLAKIMCDSIGDIIDAAAGFEDVTYDVREVRSA